MIGQMGSGQMGKVKSVLEKRSMREMFTNGTEIKFPNERLSDRKSVLLQSHFYRSNSRSFLLFD